MLEIAKTGVTMIVVTHEMEFAKRVSDHIIFMDEGRIVEQGPPLLLFNSAKEDRTKKIPAPRVGRIFIRSHLKEDLYDHLIKYFRTKYPTA